jgi:hypothetical protein
MKFGNERKEWYRRLMKDGWRDGTYRSIQSDLRLEKVNRKTVDQCFFNLDWDLYDSPISGAYRGRLSIKGTPTAVD